ncbi:unnamed protein product [Chrysodeixis includens]|uniref:Uncharacterized protein n=1 Tax=Chrysodeixis includens TaxID=689277 RepID=A0A9P0GW89_CHRIL|nr:unnamed protein product [Chrysodeixis includens]
MKLFRAVRCMLQSSSSRDLALSSKGQIRKELIVLLNTKTLQSSDFKEAMTEFVSTFLLMGRLGINHLVLFTSGLIMLNVSMESASSFAITTADCELQLTNE